MPFASSVGGKFGFEGVGGSGIVQLDAAQLNAIAAYLRGFISEFRNPSFYGYRLDGNQFFISDGGGDMYDGGNFTYPAMISGAQYTSSSSASQDTAANIGYANITPTTVDTDFVYVSLGYANSTGITANHPLTVLGIRTTVGRPIGFQGSGNSGADGGGSLSTATIYSGGLVQGFTVHAFYRQTSGASDPSHCNLVILLGHPRWGSVFGTFSSFADPTANGGNGYFFRTQGAGVTGILAITTLLSKNSGVAVTATECVDVTNAFVNRIKIVTGF